MENETPIPTVVRSGAEASEVLAVQAKIAAIGRHGDTVRREIAGVTSLP